jgi:hypothetical protein
MSSDALIGRGFTTASRHTRAAVSIRKERSPDRCTAGAIRKISRLIKLTSNTDEAVSILTTCMEGKLFIKEYDGNDSSTLSKLFQTELKELRTKRLNRYCSGWIRNVEDRLIGAIQIALSKYRNVLRTRKSRAGAASSEASMSLYDSDFTVTPSFRKTEQPSILENIAVISDDSEGIIEEEVFVAKSKVSATMSKDAEDEWYHFWFLFLEHLHLCITSKSIRGVGIRPKSYDVYRLARPIRALSSRPVEEIRSKVLKELLWIFTGASPDDNKNEFQHSNSDCRVYVVFQEQGALWIQVNIGPSVRTNQMNVREFTMVARSESAFVAMATNRMSAKKRFISYVLSAVEAGLSDSSMQSDPVQTIGKTFLCHLKDKLYRFMHVYCL